MHQPRRLYLPPYALTAVVLAAVLWLTLSPDPVPTSRFHLFEGADKVVHAIMFGSVLGAWAIDRRRAGLPTGGWMLTAAALVVIAIGALVEIAQEMMDAGRSGDLLDLLADSVGVGAAWVVSRLLIVNPKRQI